MSLKYPLPRFSFFARKNFSAILVIGFLFVFVPCSFGQGWTAQNSGTTNNLNGVAFCDTNLGWAVGSNGTILHTVNGGGTWTNQNSGTINLLRDVTFINSNTGWAVGDTGIILHTVNGGVTWTRQTSPITSNVYRVSFCNSNVGWAVGSNHDHATVIHTINGGTTWTNQICNADGMFGVAAIDSNTCWITGEWVEVYHTVDGGSTWTGRSLAESDENCLRSVTFVDNHNGWVVGEGLAHTSNRGASWVSQNPGSPNPFEYFVFWSVSFIDSSNGWVVGWPNAIIHTTNGGTTWNTQTSDTNSNLWGVSFVSANNGWVVGDNGTILHTTNGGVSVPESDNSQIPTSLSLHQNYPNPFNLTTTISFSLPKSGEITLSVFDITGRNITTLINGYRSAGSYRVPFDASGLPSGMYVYRLSTERYNEAKKLLLVK